MLERIFTFGARRRMAAGLLLVGLSLLALPGLLRLRLDTSYDSLMPPRGESYREYRKAVEEFGSDKATIIYLQDSELFSPQRLTQIQGLTEALRELDGVEGVDSLFTALNIRDRGAGLETGPLFEGVPEDPQEIAAARADALHHPILLNNLISADAQATAVTVAIHREGEGPQFYDRFHRSVDQLIQPLKGNFDRVFQIGPPRINVAIERAIFQDLRNLTPLATLILIVTIFCFLGTGVGAMGPLLTAGLSILWTFGFMGYVGIPVSLLTALLPSLLIVIGSAEDTHMLAEYLGAIRETGSGDRMQAIRIMARKIALPITINGLTTILGFFANVLNNIILIRDFALASSAAMAFSLVSTVLFVPLGASVFAPKVSRLAGENEEPGGLVGKVVRFMEWVGSKHRRKVVGVTVILTAVFTALGFRVKVLNDPLSFFKSSHPVVQDAQALHGRLAGMYAFYLILDGKEPGTFTRPEALKRLEAIQGLARRLDFDKTVSFADFIALVHREMNGGDPSFHRVPDRQDLIEQYMLFFQRSDLERYVSHDARSVNLVFRHHISDSSILREALRTLRRELPGILGDSIAFRLTGETLLIHEAADSLAVGEVKSLSLLIGVIFLIMSAMYTSLMAGLFSLIPNLIPIVLNFGTMALVGIPLNVGTAMVAAIAIGIAVDDTTHLLSRFNAERKTTTDPEEALRRTLWGEAVPVLATSISLALGFALLASSRFTVVAQFGFLSALTMLTALTADLAVTPILLRHLRLVSIWEVIGLKVGREVLTRSPLFAGMSPFAIKKAILLSQMVSAPTGRDILVQGTHGRSMYVVLTGEVEVFRQDDGRTRRIAALGPGEIFGEVGYSQPTQRTATVRALSETALLQLDFDSVQKSLRWYPGIAARLNLNIGRVLGERLASMHAQTVRGGVPDV